MPGQAPRRFASFRCAPQGGTTHNETQGLRETRTQIAHFNRKRGCDWVIYVLIKINSMTDSDAVEGLLRKDTKRRQVLIVDYAKNIKGLNVQMDKTRNNVANMEQQNEVRWYRQGIENLNHSNNS